MDNLSNLETHLGYWLRAVSNQVSYAFSRKLEAHSITVAEWVVLRLLYDVQETAPSQMAERLDMTRGAVSKLVERLVGKALVRRESGEMDRRFQVISLSTQGRELVPVLAALADQNDAEFFGHMPLEERQQLMNLLQGLARQHGFKQIPTE